MAKVDKRNTLLDRDLTKAYEALVWTGGRGGPPPDPALLFAQAGRTMIRRTLARTVGEKTGVSANTASQVFDTALDVLLDDLFRAGRLEWRGLSTFTIRSYRARKIHNPATGKVIQIPSRRTVTYKPGRSIRAGLTSTPQRSLRSHSPRRSG